MEPHSQQTSKPLENFSLDRRAVDDFRITAILCDSAQQMGGKLYILGGGWNELKAQIPTQTAIAMIISVPWVESNKQHVLECKLVDENGTPFLVKGREVANGPEKDVPYGMRANFEVGRQPGTRPGSPLSLSLALPVPALPYTVGRFEWRFFINGESRDSWRQPFEVKPAVQNVFHPEQS